MSAIKDLVFDCRHPASLARFWVAVLDGYEVAPYDDAELDRLRDIGVTDPEDDPTVLVLSADGGPRLWFQFVPEPKTSKNRLHVDLVCSDVAAEIERLRVLGAALPEHQPNPGLVVLHDPEGNEFCLLR